MKKLIFILVSLALLSSGCISSKRHLRMGRYDEAIRVSVNKLQKKPDKEKEVLNLDRAYKYAMQKDNERIAFLRKSGQPDIWDEVFFLYAKMKNRQERVRTLSPAVLAAIGFQYRDFDNDIIEAKKKAAEFLYADALRLLGTKEKFAAREAYDKLVRVKGYFSNYRDADAYMQQALNLGTSYILFSMKNSSWAILPESFETELLKISLNHMNDKWRRFETRKIEGRNYDYIIMLNLLNINVSPDGLREVHYTESKEIPDGFQYVLDANGNVMKDSLGNDIKIPKTRIISCNVVETHQKKEVIISGALDFYNLNTEQLIKTSPVASNFLFEHFSAVANGNMEALKPETREKLRLRPLPFPNDFDMIFNACGIVKDVASSIIYQNRHLIY